MNQVLFVDVYDVFIGAASEDHAQAGVDVSKQAHRRYHPYHHQLTVRNHDWLLRTDTDRLMQLLGHGTRVRDGPTSWLLPPPPTQSGPETLRSVTSSASVDWRSRRRRLPSPGRSPVRSVTDDVKVDRGNTHVDALSTSSRVQPPTVADYHTTLSSTTRSSPERQPFPVYGPLLGGVFPSSTSTSSHSLLAYEMLATAALSSLRNALPFASLLPPSSTSYDVISAAAAAAALLQPATTQQLGAFTAPNVGDVDHGGSVLDLVVHAPSQSETTGDDSQDVKHSPCRDADQLSDVSPRPRGCVWRPY